MSIQIRPSRARVMNGGAALNIIESTLAAAGAKMPNYPEVKNARKIIEREQELSEQFQQILGTNATTHNEALADQIIEANVSVAQGIVAAAEAEASRGKAAAGLRDMVKRKTAARAAAELASVGDRWIIDVFRPLIAVIVTELEGMTDLVDKCGPRGPMTGHDDRDTRDRWTRANDLAQDLEALHSVADRLRNMAIIPASDRDVSAEYRWAHLDRLGTFGTDALPILANMKNGAGAGIYTETETVLHVEQAEERRREKRRASARTFVGPGVTA